VAEDIASAAVVAAAAAGKQDNTLQFKVQQKAAVTGTVSSSLPTNSTSPTPTPTPAPAFNNRAVLSFNCYDRLIDHVDVLFQQPPTITGNYYIVNCPPCSYPTNQPLDVWGGQTTGWYTLDSVFCAAAKHQFAYSGAGGYEVDVELNVLTNTVPTFQGQDMGEPNGATRSWHAPYPVMFQMSEITEGSTPPEPVLLSAKTRLSLSPGFLETLKALAHDRFRLK